MNSNPSLEELRELFLSSPDLEATRGLALAISLALAVVVIWLVGRRRLREEYTPIWLAVSAALVVVSLRLDLLRDLSRLLGAWAPSATLFFLGELFLLAICLNYAVRLSRASMLTKNLAQEIAILSARIARVERREPPE